MDVAQLAARCALLREPEQQRANGNLVILPDGQFPPEKRLPALSGFVDPCQVLGPDPAVAIAARDGNLHHAIHRRPLSSPTKAGWPSRRRFLERDGCQAPTS